MFTPLNYPKTSLRLSKKGSDIYVWDIFRKKQLLLTPEEWVRQHVLHYLHNEKSVPLALIASEYAIEVNQLQRRCDGVVFNSAGAPIAIIECKASHVKLTEKVFFQIAQYNYKLQVQWLIMTNGLETIIARVNQTTGEIQYIKEIPDFQTMQAK